MCEQSWRDRPWPSHARISDTTRRAYCLKGRGKAVMWFFIFNKTDLAAGWELNANEQQKMRIERTIASGPKERLAWPEWESRR